MPLAMFPFTAIVAFVIRFEIEVPYKLICRWDVSLPERARVGMPGMCWPCIRLIFILTACFNKKEFAVRLRLERDWCSMFYSTDSITFL